MNNDLYKNLNSACKQSIWKLDLKENPKNDFLGNIYCSANATLDILVINSFMIFK